MSKILFPKDFLWGAATSAHQVEGGNHNDWTEWEKSEKRLAALKGRKLNPVDFISNRAADHYHLFEKDFDILKSLNLNAYRFSIEWSRIEPEEGKFDQQEIEHYKAVIRALREQNIKPLITLWHWTFPVWVKNGWEFPNVSFYFARFCRKIGEEFKNEVRFWNILNEPQYWLWHSHIIGDFPPERKNIFLMFLVYKNMIRGHKEAFKALKNINPDFQIGVIESTGWFEPWIFRFVFQNIRNFLFPYFVSNYFDFFGLNYYRKENFLKKANNRVSESEWEIFPEGIYWNIMRCYKYFKKPIIITENGTPDAEDKIRPHFIKEHLMWIGKAIKEGVDIRGYFHWSLLDNFEWESGYKPRFGLVEIDYKTLERKPRPSSSVYAEIAKSNTIEINN